MNHLRLWLALAVGLSAIPATAQSRQGPARAEIEVRRWRPTLNADWRFGGAGDSFDPSADLGVESQQGFSINSVVSVTRRLRVRFSRVNFTYDNEAPAATNLTILGSAIDVGEPVATRMELLQLSGGAEFALFTNQDGFFSIVGDYAQLRAEPTFTVRGSDLVPDSIDLRMPVLGFRTRVNLTPALYASVEAIGMKRETVGVYTDFTASVGYGVTPNIYVTYGYRNLYARDKSIEPGGDRAVFRLKSNFVGVAIRF